MEKKNKQKTTTKKNNSLILLGGMQPTTATIEKSVKIVLKKNGNRTAICPSNPTDGHTLQGNQKETRVPHCSLQHCLQQLGHGSKLDVFWQTNE